MSRKPSAAPRGRSRHTNKRRGQPKNRNLRISRRRELALLAVAAAALSLLLVLITGNGDTPQTLVQNTPQDATQDTASTSHGSAAPADIQRQTPVAAVDTSHADTASVAATHERDTARSNNGVPRFSIALIIDDLGNSEQAGQRAINLPADLTFAVLPHTPHGRSLAEYAHRAGREVMLHMPMSNTAQIPVGPGGLTPDLDEADFRQRLLQALADVPHVRGVNNHMGSELTAQQQPMHWLMQELQALQLYFIDSYTTADSVAGNVAASHHIPSDRRHVFLDHSISSDEIHFQFQRLLDTARRDGYAIGIGHPYPETLDYLEAALPALADSDIEVVRVSALLSRNGQLPHSVIAD